MASPTIGDDEARELMRQVTEQAGKRVEKRRAGVADRVAEDSPVTDPLAVALVVVTFLVCVATWRLGVQTRRLAEESREQRFDLHRPVLYPAGRLSHQNGALVEGQHYPIALHNAGTGVALDICGVLFGPAPPPALRRGSSGTYPRWKAAPLPAGACRDVTVEAGQPLRLVVRDIAKCPLAAPPGVVARLTLTYHDILGRRHAGVFDYSARAEDWQWLASPANIGQDLAELDAAGGVQA